MLGAPILLVVCVWYVVGSFIEWIEKKVATRSKAASEKTLHANMAEAKRQREEGKPWL